MSKIDVHHHVLPPFLAEALTAAGGDSIGWFVASNKPKDFHSKTLEWTLDLDRSLCARIGIKTAILSPTSPFPDCVPNATDQAILARRINTFCAEIRDADPAHYGFFAGLPSLLTRELCLAEIAHAFDVLHADGAILLSRYGTGTHYLGHPDFHPIWDELNRRKAVVFVHPCYAADTNLVSPAMPAPMFDYPHETGRTAADLITSNTLRDHAKDCKIILSHAGGTLPMLIGRLAGMLPKTPFGPGDKTTEEIREEASWFYFDTAISSDPGQLAALQHLAKEDHILFGSDFPNCPVEGVAAFTKQLDESDVLEEKHRLGINGRAGRKLFPRLAQYE